MGGGPQFEPFLGFWSKSIPWIDVDCLFILIILYLVLYFALTTVPGIVFAIRSRSCDGYVTLFIYVTHPANSNWKIQVTRSRQCKLQMTLPLALGVWTSLLLLLWRRSRGSKLSAMKVRLGTFLTVTSVLCVLAILGEIAYSLIVMGMSNGGSKGQFFGFSALGRLVSLIMYPMLYLPYRASL